MTQIRNELVTPEKVSRDLLADALESRYAFRVQDGAEVQTTTVGLVRFIRLEDNSALYKRDDADTTTPHDNSTDPVTVVSLDQIRFKKVTQAIEVPDSYLLSHIEIKGIFNEPPGDEQNGDIIIVGTSPSGDFAGQSGKYAIKNDSGYTFISPKKMDTAFSDGVFWQYRLENPDETDDVGTYKWRVGPSVIVFNEGSVPHDKLSQGTAGNILGFLQSGNVGEIDIAQLQIGVAQVSGLGESSSYQSGQTKAYDLNAEFTNIDFQSGVDVSLSAQGEIVLTAGRYVLFPTYALVDVTLNTHDMKLFDGANEISNIEDAGNPSYGFHVIESSSSLTLRVNAVGTGYNGNSGTATLSFSRSSCLIVKVA